MAVGRLFHRKKEWKCARYLKYCQLEWMTQTASQQVGVAGEQRWAEGHGGGSSPSWAKLSVQTSVRFAQGRYPSGCGRGIPGVGHGGGRPCRARSRAMPRVCPRQPWPDPGGVKGADVESGGDGQSCACDSGEGRLGPALCGQLELGRDGRSRPGRSWEQAGAEQE